MTIEPVYDCTTTTIATNSIVLQHYCVIDNSGNRLLIGTLQECTDFINYREAFKGTLSD